MAREQINMTANLRNEQNKVVRSREMVAEFDFGSSLEDASKKYGADTVFALYVDAARISAQSYGRGLLMKVDDKGANKLSDAECKATFNKEWSPRIGRKPATPEKIKTELARWMAKAKAAGLKIS
jgi:hypothetical protein